MAGELRYHYTDVIGRKNPVSDAYEPLSGVRVRGYKLDAAGTRPGAPNTIYTTRAGGGPMTEFLTVDGSVSVFLDPGDWEIEYVDQNAGGKRIADMVVSVQAVMGKDQGLLANQLPELGRALCPVGTILPFAGTAAPAGWALCLGQTVDGSAGTAYANLYGVIGTTYGGSGPATMRLPDLQGRMPVGKGTHAEIDTLGDSDGLAVGSRKVKHKHGMGDAAVTGPGRHQHGMHVAFGPQSGFINNLPLYIQNNANIGQTDPSRQYDTYVNTEPNQGDHTHGLSGNVGDTTGPTDGPAFLVLNYIVKL